MRNIHLTPQLIRAVRDAVDIVAIAGDHTRLTKRGRRHQGLCPLHKEKTPSFSVDPVQGLFYCFGCGAGGDAIKLHMLATGDDFPSAIESLAGRYGIPLPVAPGPRGGKEERSLQAALEAALEFFRRSLAGAAAPRAYLGERRIPESLVERFGLGYAPDDWQGLLNALDRKVPAADLEAAGLVGRRESDGKPFDRFRNRLMFPIHTPSGRLVGFGGRTLGDDRAKYVNTSETEEFHKGRLLYGLHLAKQAIREHGSAVLVEGYFDVLGAVASGVEWAVASMGTALTPEQARLLARYTDEAVVGYDGDNAGEGAFRRALPILLAEGLAVRRARFGAGHDPDSLRLAEGEDAVARAVEAAEDGVLAEIERLAPPRGERRPHDQAKAADEVAALLKPIHDPIVRLGYGRLAAEKLGIPTDLLWRRGKDEPSPRPDPPRTETRARVPAPPRRLVRSQEEQVLGLLLSGGPVPPPAGLPDQEVFFDPVCRNIFQAFRALHSEGGEPPTAKDLIASLAADGGAVDRLAQILLESSVALENAALPALLDSLVRRWRKQRLDLLARELSEAERRGDGARFERLLQERTELSQEHYRTPLRRP